MQCLATKSIAPESVSNRPSLLILMSKGTGTVFCTLYCWRGRLMDRPTSWSGGAELGPSLRGETENRSRCAKEETTGMACMRTNNEFSENYLSYEN